MFESKQCDGSGPYPAGVKSKDPAAGSAADKAKALPHTLRATSSTVC